MNIHPCLWTEEDHPGTSWVWPEPWVPGEPEAEGNLCLVCIWGPAQGAESPRTGHTAAGPQFTWTPDTNYPTPPSQLSPYRLPESLCIHRSTGTKCLLSKSWLSLCSSPGPKPGPLPGTDPPQGRHWAHYAISQPTSPGPSSRPFHPCPSVSLEENLLPDS